MEEELELLMSCAAYSSRAEDGLHVGATAVACWERAWRWAGETGPGMRRHLLLHERRAAGRKPCFPTMVAG